MVFGMVLASSGADAQAEVPDFEPARQPADKANPANHVEAEIRQLLAELPGRTSMVFTQLTDSGPVVLHGVDADEPMAIGSGFKLFVFGTLADEVNQHRRRLENVMQLEAKLLGPPHSEMADWPMGSPVTLNTLTLKMISISDNTATDHLIHLLGRRPIERQMVTMGNRHAELNLPLMDTRDMVMLRDRKTGLPGKKYQKLDEAGRRAFLADHFQGVPDYDALDFDTGAFDLAEWYASPLDMARTMDWIYRHTQKGMPAASMRAILAIDPKLKCDPKVWPYVGFKGGSEDQLLAGNWLMQNANGNWYTFHVFYNSPEQKVDQAQMVEVVTKIQQAIEAALQKP